MRLTSARLIITEFSPRMAQALYQNSLDEDNRRFTPDGVYQSAEEAAGKIAGFLEAYRRDTAPFVYAVQQKDGTVIGNIQLVEFDGAWEIGYHIAKPFACRGYATEAVRVFLPWIAAKVQAEAIYGVCLTDNTASRKVLERAGFVKYFEGLGRYNGRPENICRYRYDCRSQAATEL